MATRRSTACSSRSIRNTSNTPTRSKSCRSRHRAATLIPLQSVVTQRNRRPAVGQSLRPAAVRVGLVRTAAGRVAGRRRRSHPRGRARHASADGQHRVRGLGEGLPGIDEEPRAAAVHRHRRRLHRAGRALRELHPPDDDSFGSALGRPGRADHAVAVRQRAEYLFVRRPHHADRHRQKERDHADRLRARRRAPARDVADRSDPTKAASFASVRS